MKTIALPWETWRAIIPVLREKGIPSMLEHADQVERQLEQNPPDQPMVSLTLTEDLFLRSSTWARWHVGIALPVE